MTDVPRPALPETDPTPVLALETAFRHIAATRMAGLAILNPALAVEAVGFRRHGDRWIGVLVTPWFMNLVALPHASEDWSGLASGSRVDIQLPGGPVEALTAWEEVVGDYLSCSLFSPMQAFPDQAYAREVAREVLERLFTPPAPETDTGPTPGEARTVSRRGFLAALLPGERAP